MKEIMYQFTEAELNTLAIELIHQLVKFIESDGLVEPVVTHKEDHQFLMTVRDISNIINYSYAGTHGLIRQNQIAFKVGKLYDVREVIAVIPFKRRKNIKPL